MSAPAPSLPLSAQLADVVRKCAPRPYRRPRIQPCPRGYTCPCHAQAIVMDGDDTFLCASCACDAYDIDALYDATRDTDAAGEVLGVALDGFARGVNYAQEAAEYASTPALREGNGR